MVSPLTVDGEGAVYYTVVKLDAEAPWTRDVAEAYLVKIESGGEARKVSFAELIPDAPQGEDCLTTFAGSLPWPPTLDGMLPRATAAGSGLGLNAAPAVGAGCTIVAASRAHFNFRLQLRGGGERRPDSTVERHVAGPAQRWLRRAAAAKRDGGRMPGREPDGSGWRRNQWPAGRVVDQSTASPVIAPDGSVLYGAYTSYNYSRGHLFRFSAGGEYIGSYDFGWDITPAVYEHDGTWSVIVKDNFYPVGSYCGAVEYCVRAEARYSLTSLTADLLPQWSYRNTNDQVCERLGDGSIRCEPAAQAGFEWCVNTVAVDRDGVVYANSEDGNLYAINRRGRRLGGCF